MCGTDACRDYLRGQDGRCGSTGQDVQGGQGSQCMGHSLQSGCGQQKVALIHGPQGPRGETWPQWTSETNVSQWPPEWCYICWRGLLNTVGPSNGRPDEIFLEWSSRTACNLRGTVSGTRCVAHFMHAKTICMAKAWNMVQRAHTCKAVHLANTQDVIPTPKTWPARHNTKTWALVYACRDAVSEDLTDRCRPTATRMVLYMLERAADHDGTIRWLLR